MEAALIQLWLAAAGIGAVANRNVFWLQRPQASKLPALVLQTIAGSPLYGMAGRVGLSGKLVQHDCWGATMADALALRDALIAAADAQNAHALANPSGAGLRALFVRSQRDLSEPAAAGQPALFRASLDIEVWFLEA